VDEAEGRFAVIKYSDGAVEREAVDQDKKPSRRPRRPQQKLKIEGMNWPEEKRTELKHDAEQAAN